MEYKSGIITTPHKKICFNYFKSKNERHQIKLEERDRDRYKGHSFVSKNCPQLKQLSTEKYINFKKDKMRKNANRTYSNNLSHNKSSVQENNNINNYSQNFDVNLNFNLNVTNPSSKKIEEFLNNNFCKLDESKLSKIISKSPINCRLNTYTNTTINNYNNSGLGLGSSNFIKYSKLNFLNKQKKQKISNFKSFDNFKIQKLSNVTNYTTLKSFTNDNFLLNNENNYTNNKLKQGKKSENENRYSTSSWNKIKNLKHILSKLKIKNNKKINKEVEQKYNLHLENPKKLNKLRESKVISTEKEKEKKILKQTVEDIYKKFNSMLKENKKLKQIIKSKTEEFTKIYNEINLFKKEIKSIKTGIHNCRSINCNNSITGLKGMNSLNKNNLKIKTEIKIASPKLRLTALDTYLTTNVNTNPTSMGNNCDTINNITLYDKIKKTFNMPPKNSLTKIKTPVRVNKKRYILEDLSKLDTIDLLNRVQLDDPSNIIYYPKKINVKSNLNNFNIPKLDISTAMQELEEYDRLLEKDNKDINKPEESKIDNFNFDNSSQLSQLQIQLNEEEDKLNDAFVIEKENTLSDSSNLAIGDNTFFKSQNNKSDFGNSCSYSLYEK